MKPASTLVTRLPPCPSLSKAEGALLRALQTLTREASHAEASYLRIEQPISTDTEVLDWLRRFPALPRFYWGNRGGYLALAGVGIAADVEGPDFSVIPAFLSAVASGEGAASVRILAWARFDRRARTAPEWVPFGRVRAVLPLLELRRTSARVVLSVTLPTADAAAFEAQRARAQRALRDGAPLKTPPAAKPPLDGHLDPDEALWTRQVTHILREIDQQQLEKAVLARRRTCPVTVDALDLLARRMPTGPESFHILIEPVPFAAFIAATPERLYYRDGRRIETEALAGTRSRGATEREDAQQIRDLQRSAKDQHEHALVRRDIVRSLTPLCEGILVPPPPVVTSLPHLHHLRTPITGKLKPDVDDARLLSALHPTPAVCGTPTGVALHLLRTTEQFDRGLYSGPIGCFGPADAEVAVGIRSALVRRDAVQLLAGAGIVAGSTPALEWQETAAKMKGLEQLLEPDEPA